jgi:hypothetical protein
MKAEVASISSHLTDVERFLGATISHVNRLIRLMVIEHDGPLPEFLRGVHRLDQLPRYTSKTQPHVFEIPLIRDREIALRVMWIVENTTGLWCMNEDGFSFENTESALAYRLRWE